MKHKPIFISQEHLEKHQLLSGVKIHLKTFGLGKWVQRVGSHYGTIKNLFVIRGKVEVEVATTEKDVQALLPGSCLVEVNSWKSEQITGLYSIRGKRAFFFDLLPKLAKRGGFE